MKLVSGLLAGAATGAILGVLFAPKKGAELRKIIAKKSCDLTNSVKDTVNKISDTVTNKYENIKEDAMNLMEKEKEKVATVKAGVKAQQVM